MSVIGTVVAVPNRLQILWTMLRDAGANGIERERLKRLVVPTSLDTGESSEGESGTSLFDESLNELTRSGFAKFVKKRVSLDGPASGDFLECVDRTLLAPDIDVDTERGYLAGAISWFLTREPTKPLSWGSAPLDALRADFGENSNTFDITNLSRWQNFAYWARFLGYATFVEIGGHPTVLPDTKTALCRHMDAALPAKKETPIGTFLKRLATITPVFEGGAARSSIENRLADNRQRATRELSLATSLALRRLQIAGILNPIRRDDAEIWTAPGLRDPRVSHFKRG